MSRTLLTGCVFAMVVQLTGVDHAYAKTRGVVLTEDVAVTFSLVTNKPILPGQPIDFELTATNHGDDSVPQLTLSSSTFVHEILPGPSDCTLITVVADGEDFFVYYLNWYLAGAVGSPLLAGESRTCRFQMALTSAAPAEFPFTFGLPTYYSDPNPANDRVTLILRRGDLAPTTLPANSRFAMLVLVLGLVVAAGIGIRSRARRRVG